MIQLLEKKIDDKRFVKLIRKMLIAGYLEDWTYNETYSGTPQGGVVSPILSNIYLHELDLYMNQLEEEFTKGKRRKHNPKYKQLENQKELIRKKINEKGRQPDLIQQLKELDKAQKQLPSGDQHDEGYRRLLYCRYADDFIVGVIGTLSETQEILEKVTTFLNDELKLQLSPDKTGITTGKEGTKFLNYLISTHSDNKIISKGRYTKRTVSERISLRVPDRKAQEFCQKYGYGDWQTNKPTHRPELMNASDEEIITTYNAELRGLANYYSLAKDVKSKLHKLEYLSNYSLFKTLATKHKTKMAEILTKLKQGNEFVHRDTVKGKIHELEVFQLKRMGKQKKNWNIDEVPRTLYLTASRTELIRRIFKGECEYCKRNDVPTEVHHVRKLKDLKNKPNLTMWQKVMIVRNRKTIILCVECHNLLHAGKLPDERYSR